LKVWWLTEIFKVKRSGTQSNAEGEFKRSIKFPSHLCVGPLVPMGGLYVYINKSVILRQIKYKFVRLNL